MPLDLRKIVFSNAEIQAALVSYCLQHDVAMPETHIDNVELNWNSDLEVRIKFVSSRPDGEGKMLKFNISEVGAALILYLHQHEDPLPHQAVKIVEPIDDDGLCLCLRYPWGDMWGDGHPGFDMDWQSRDGKTHHIAQAAKS